MITLEIAADTKATDGDQFTLSWEVTEATSEVIMSLSDEYLIDPLYAAILSFDECVPDGFKSSLTATVFKSDEPSDDDKTRYIRSSVDRSDSVGKYAYSGILSQFRTSEEKWLNEESFARYNPEILIETAYRLSVDHDVEINFRVDSAKLTTSVAIQEELPNLIDVESTQVTDNEDEKD